MYDAENSGMIIPRTDTQVIEKPVEAAPDKKTFSTNGGVGVEARDVKATIGVDKLDKSVTVGDNSTLTINNDNSKTVNKNRDVITAQNDAETSGKATGSHIVSPSRFDSAVNMACSATADKASEQSMSR